MAGHAYPNPSYTLDLVREAGVRYLWDGGMSPIIGQDRPLSQWSQHREREATAFRTGLRLTARKLRAIAGSIESGHSNKAYRIRRFPDGQAFYTFQRHGHWEWADIDGLGRLLSAERMERLAANGGTCIAYTHLGKRRANRDHAEKHIPEGTLDALRRLQERWRRGDIMLSSTARMLDYLVLRDHLQIDHASNTVRFMPDGIAFTQCTRSELQGHRFTITGLRLAGLSVLGTEGPLDHTVEEHRGAGLTITLK